MMALVRRKGQHLEKLPGTSKVTALLMTGSCFTVCVLSQSWEHDNVSASGNPKIRLLMQY